jgi:hypothetical protein
MSGANETACDHGYNTMLADRSDPYKEVMNAVVRCCFHSFATLAATMPAVVDKMKSKGVKLETLRKKLVAYGLRELDSRDSRVNKRPEHLFVLTCIVIQVERELDTTVIGK